MFNVPKNVALRRVFADSSGREKNILPLALLDLEQGQGFFII
jgi:hypothetical protein